MMRGAYDNWASSPVDDFFTGTRKNDDYYRLPMEDDFYRPMPTIIPSDRVEPLPPKQDFPPQQDFLPVFPNYTVLSCADLQTEVKDLDNILLTSRFSNPDVRLAYENALARAQAELNKKCKSADVFIDDSKRDIKVEVPKSQSPKTFYDDKDDKEKPKEVVVQEPKKDSQSYLYIGLGLVALLLIANLLKKEQNG